MVRSLFVCSALVGALTLAGCGSSSGGAVSGLTAPGGVSVVTPTGGAGVPGSITPGAGVGDFPADADYFSDLASAYVYDPSIEPMFLVNEILCMVEQTRPDALVNQPVYLAQIDVGLCQRGTQGGGTGQSAGGASEFEIWTVRSTRANNASPQPFHVWVPNDDQDFGGPMTIFVEGQITREPSAGAPFGEFGFSFASTPDAAPDLDNPVFFGTLSTFVPSPGRVGYRFYMEQGDVTQVPLPGEQFETVQVIVDMQGDETQGDARIYREYRFDFGGGDSGILIDESTLAFDATHVLRSLNGAAAEELDRTDFDENVWSYNLYWADGVDIGDRVELNGGFGIQDAGGNYGWADYYGVWMNDQDQILTTGETVTQDDYGTSAPATYTVVAAPGKLMKYTQATVNLVDIDGYTFNWWGSDGVGGYANYLVLYTAGIFTKEQVWNDGTQQWDDIVPPQVIDTAAEGYLYMWSDVLGGQVVFVDGETTLTYFEQEFVNGASDLFTAGTSVSLYGYFDCLKNDISEVDAEAGNIFLADAAGVLTPHEFAIDSSDLLLMLDTDGLGTMAPVQLVPGAEPSTGSYTWGMTSGPMVTDTSGFVAMDDIWQATEFYTWETGHNSWNHYTALVDVAGDFVEFDAPIQFLYTHSTANDRAGEATNDGVKAQLQYAGNGNLWGFPSTGVDFDGDLQDDRWYADFGIADGVILGPTGIEYVVKAIDIEQTLTADPGGAPGLSLAAAAALTLPDGSDYTTPDIGPKPTVTDPPRVVDGELVDAGI